VRARLLTAAIGIPVFLGAAVAGGVWWLLLVSFIAVVGLAEWHGLARRALQVSPPWDALLGGGLAVLLAAYNAVGKPGAPGLGAGAAMFGVAVYALAREALSRRRRPAAAGGAAALGVVYVAGCLAHLLLLRGFEHPAAAAPGGGWAPDGFALTLLAVGGTWLTDTGAFFVGRAVGGRKLMPALSPNKTVSGAVGGWVAGFVGLLAGGVFLAEIPLTKALVLAAATPVAAQLGDLLQSALKREAGVKDSGRLLPGHGGVLDRFDSLMLAAPTVYYLSIWL